MDFVLDNERIEVSCGEINNKDTKHKAKLFEYLDFEQQLFEIENKLKNIKILKNLKMTNMYNVN